MFAAAAERFLRRAREIQPEELRRFAARVSALLQGPEPGPEAVDGLQSLHLTVAATKYPRKLDGEFVELLQTVLCSPKSPEQIQVLCAAILREMSPCNDLILSCDEIQDTKLLSLVSSVLLAQGNKGEVAAVGQRVVKALERRLPEGQNAQFLLPVLANVLSLSPGSLTEEQIDVVSKKLADWLRYASIQQGMAQPSGGFFSSPRTKQFLAWNSPPLISEFVDLLPFLLDPGTTIEIFHLLLDLPCLTAALDIQLRAAALSASEKAGADPAGKAATCLEAFGHPLYKSLFQYLLRTKAAPEDAPESLVPLRQLLGSLAGSPRVVQCAETVPVLLELFFRVVAEFADGSLINQLVVLLLQKSDQLYEILAFKEDVYRVLGSQLATLCRLRPALLVELSTEILEFLGAVSNIQSKEAIFTHLAWAVGEFLSVSHDKRCTVEQITRFFEPLEAVLFEITQLQPQASTPSCAPHAISVLMATLTKLAARSQDLIPRVSMFLSKMRTFVQSPAVTSVYREEDLEEILIRATELMNLLKMPSVAQFVLTPPVASTQFQREVNDSLPLALRMVTQLLEPAPGSVPV
uniref:AP-5 complex subunit zeta-1 n=1 Tax=Lonchura striata TaxID=40157 RepID=UPI000B4C4F21|nr:AP-5 complex subunit zeta-1 [Lonchura striata domestica]